MKKEFKKWEVYGKQPPYLVREVGKYGGWIANNIVVLEVAEHIVSDHNAAPELLENAEKALDLLEAIACEYGARLDGTELETTATRQALNAAIMKAKGE